MDGLHSFLSPLRALAQFLVLPPSGFLFLVVVGLAIRRSYKRSGTILAGIGIALLYILSLPIVGGLLIASLENAQIAPSNTPEPAAIIILGGDADRTPDPLVSTAPGPLSMQRLAGAAILARRTGLPVLITGGTLSEDEPPVADIMADLFHDAFGLPVEWRETRAENTCENARYSADILRKAGIGSALVVTHSWHMPRALLSFQRAGYPVIAAPLYADVHEVKGFSDFLPHTNAWVRSFYAIHEWIGLLAYQMGVCPRTSSIEPAPITRPAGS